MSLEALHAAVAETLGREIADGVRPPGSVLTLDQIQSRFAVSRTVAREAMRSLESVRMVQPRRRVGLVVLPDSRWDVFDPMLIGWRLAGPGRRSQLHSLTELRAAVEPIAASGVARHADRATRLRLVELAAQMRELGEAGDLDAFLELDIDFHQTLLRASRNELFAALADVVAVVLTSRVRLGLVSPHPAEIALAGHEEVARAISDFDPHAAEAAMLAIMGEVRSSLEHRAPVRDRGQDDGQPRPAPALLVAAGQGVEVGQLGLEVAAEPGADLGLERPQRRHPGLQLAALALELLD